MAGTTQRPDNRQLRLRWLIAVVAVMVVLTAGWPLLNLAVSDRQALKPGTRLVIGAGAASSARITVGPGWAMAPAQSNPQLGYHLDRGPVSLAADYVALQAGTSRSQLWAGLRSALRVDQPGASLGKPRTVISAQGRTGLAGTVVTGNRSGTVTIFPAPSGKFAIEMLLLAPQGTGQANLATAQRIVRSVLFPAARR